MPRELAKHTISKAQSMKLGILRFSQVDEALLLGIQQGLLQAFPDAKCSIVKESLPIPEKAFDKKRKQYNSSLILNEIKIYTQRREDFQCVLGIIDVDIFVPELNYVFGEAYVLGKAALISLFRLKPEFYKEAANKELFRNPKPALNITIHPFLFYFLRTRQF